MSDPLETWKRHVPNGTMPPKSTLGRIVHSAKKWRRVVNAGVALLGDHNALVLMWVPEWAIYSRDGDGWVHIEGDGFTVGERLER